jgi:tetratricopeptide (TPR) repeat protein
MIVRNEEMVLARCLESLKGFVDELIVVDTGSKDNTVSVAKSYGAKVFHFEWCDDFSAARNESIKHASTDWILQLDADEALLANSISPLRRALSNPWHLVYSIKCDQGPEDPHRFAWVARLFRNHPELGYSRPYHETVIQSARELMSKEPRWQIQREPSITIRHYGYEQSAMPEKYDRGRRIMESYIARHPDDWYMLSQLGTVYLAQGLDDRAEACLKRALDINPNSPDTNYTMGTLRQKQGNVDAAIQCYKKATAGDSLLAEAHVWLGGIWIDKGMYDEAISELKKAVAINPDMALGYSNLGLAYVNKGMHDRGIGQLKKAISLAPELANAHLNLGFAYTRTGKPEEAIVEFKEALRMDPDYGKAHYNLASLYYKKGAHAEAIKHCDKALELEVEIHPQLLKWLEPFR